MALVTNAWNYAVPHGSNSGTVAWRDGERVAAVVCLSVNCLEKCATTLEDQQPVD